MASPAISKTGNALCFIGLGSNLDEPVNQIKAALQYLHHSANTKVLKCSSCYQSKPLGPQNQDHFVNAVVQIETRLNPLELLDLLNEIEDQQGRKRNVQRWGPRTIDLDLLLFAQQTLTSPRLTIPHPEMENRVFVLIPLNEIAPELILPSQKKVSTLAENCAQDGIIKLQEVLW